MVETLLKAGADPNAIDSDNSSALVIAIHRASDWRKKADLLLGNGAKIDATFGERRLPLVHSLALTEPQLYYLIQKGASVHAVDPSTQASVLARATYRDYFCTDRLFSLLFERGAKLETLDDERLTPLGNAVKYDHPECVGQLLKRGASTDDVWADRHGKVGALFMALSGYVDDEKDNYAPDLVKRIRIIKMLRERGAVLGFRELWIVTEGTVASFFSSEELYKSISADDYILEKAAGSQNPELRRLAARQYLEKAREGADAAGNRDELNNALKDCNAARSLYEGDKRQKEAVPEMHLYCGLLEHQLGGMDQAANADLRKYLELSPAAPNAKNIRALLKNPDR